MSEEQFRFFLFNDKGCYKALKVDEKLSFAKKRLLRLDDATLSRREKYIQEIESIMKRHSKLSQEHFFFTVLTMDRFFDYSKCDLYPMKDMEYFCISCVLTGAKYLGDNNPFKVKEHYKIIGKSFD